MDSMDFLMHDVSNTKLKSKKSENYTVAEDLILIATWEHTSEDAVAGTDQGKDQYWSRVWQEYTTNAESYPFRTEKSIVNRFSTIRTMCLKFASIVQSIEYLNPSGMTEQDKLIEAIKIWAKEEKDRGGFKLLHCFNVLKNKWITEVVQPSLNRSTPASYSINVEGDENASGHVELERSIGRKAKKERQKRKKMKAEDSGESLASTNFRESQELMGQMHDQKIVIAAEDLKKKDEYFEMKREKLELDRKTYELQNMANKSDKEWREEKLMTVDMTKLTEMQRKYLEMKQQKIFERASNS